MKILLDTHIILWAIEDSINLPPEFRNMILDEKNDIYVSAASFWEIALKHKKHPSLMPFSAKQIREYCQRSGYIFLSLSIDSVSSFENLDLSSNQDPFDQILTSQASCNNMVLLTHDARIANYNLPCVKYC